MDYKDLAQEYLEVMFSMRGRNTQKQIDESLNGENFVLFYILEQNGNVIPSDISNAMGSTSARIATVLNNLEKKGLISRTIDTEDRRRIIVNLTDAGKEYVHEQNQKRVEFITNMLKYLGENDAKEYIRIMKKLVGKSPEDFM